MSLLIWLLLSELGHECVRRLGKCRVGWGNVCQVCVHAVSRCVEYVCTLEHPLHSFVCHVIPAHQLSVPHLCVPPLPFFQGDAAIEGACKNV